MAGSGGGMCLICVAKEGNAHAVLNPPPVKELSSLSLFSLLSLLLALPLLSPSYHAPRAVRCDAPAPPPCCLRPLLPPPRSFSPPFCTLLGVPAAAHILCGRPARGPALPLALALAPTARRPAARRPDQPHAQHRSAKRHPRPLASSPAPPSARSTGSTGRPSRRSSTLPSPGTICRRRRPRSSPRRPSLCRTTPTPTSSKCWASALAGVCSCLSKSVAAGMAQLSAAARRQCPEQKRTGRGGGASWWAHYSRNHVPPPPPPARPSLCCWSCASAARCTTSSASAADGPAARRALTWPRKSACASSWPTPSSFSTARTLCTAVRLPGLARGRCVACCLCAARPYAHHCAAPCVVLLLCSPFLPLDLSPPFPAVDLGARSCFVDQQDNVKLSLFGVGKSMCPQDYSTLPSLGSRAVRWLVRGPPAPIYSSASRRQAPSAAAPLPAPLRPVPPPRPAARDVYQWNHRPDVGHVDVWRPDVGCVPQAREAWAAAWGSGLFC